MDKPCRGKFYSSVTVWRSFRTELSSRRPGGKFRARSVNVTPGTVRSRRVPGPGGPASRRPAPRRGPSAAAQSFCFGVCRNACSFNASSNALRLRGGMRHEVEGWGRKERGMLTHCEAARRSKSRSENESGRSGSRTAFDRLEIGQSVSTCNHENRSSP